MKARLIGLVVGLFCLSAIESQADPLVESVQQKLKDQGFYYGEVTGTKDAETTAAIRRFQIRNGLAIDGELNAQTQKSLGVRGPTPAPRSTPAAPPPAPTSAPRRLPPTETFDLRDDEPTENEEDASDDGFSSPEPTRGIELFADTPYEEAGPDAQADIIAAVQSVLARRGYYRSGIDGVFGSGTAFALRAYQARFGIVQTGRPDAETLATMGLLPGQRGPGLTAPRDRGPARSYIGPDGERIYVPR